MATIINFIQRSLIALIRCYRFIISALLGPCCRFEPTCSQYAMLAIQTHGSFKGCCLTLRRVLCCHPWHPGGFDPVPFSQRPVKKSQKAEGKSFFLN